MSKINVQNLTFSYDGGYKNIFDDVSFTLDTDWKTGFVGRNGRGKTTFLKLLTGQYEYRGKISANVEFVYFPFEVGDQSRICIDVLSELCIAEEWEILRELALLDVDAEILYRPFASLSGGEKTKALLSALFLNDGKFLLIDEPTNHLDADGRTTVARYLARKKGFILVSHDRAFLDGCVDHIISINKTDIEVSAGNYSVWESNFNNRLAFESARNEKLKKEIDRLAESAARTAAWADKTEASKYGKASSGLKQDKGYVGHKAAKMMRSAKSVEKRRFDAIEQKQELLKDREYSAPLILRPLEYRSERLIALSDLQAVYGGRPIFPPTSFEILRGERIALTGKNGCGKSTVLKLIAGEDIAHSGGLAVGSGLVISYVPQTSDGIGGNLRDFAERNAIDRALFLTILRKMGFDRVDFDADISELSQGQKKKILIAKSLCDSAHLYVWDEPLNYIDLYTRIQIEGLINEFRPTMLFVEHDGAFRAAVATKTVEL